MAEMIQAKKFRLRWVVQFSTDEPTSDPPEGWDWLPDEDNIWFPFGWDPTAQPKLDQPILAWRRMAMKEEEQADGSAETEG